MDWKVQSIDTPEQLNYVWPLVKSTWSGSSWHPSKAETVFARLAPWNNSGATHHNGRKLTQRHQDERRLDRHEIAQEIPSWMVRDAKLRSRATATLADSGDSKSDMRELRDWDDDHVWQRLLDLDKADTRWTSAGWFVDAPYSSTPAVDKNAAAETGGAKSNFLQDADKAIVRAPDRVPAAVALFIVAFPRVPADSIDSGEQAPGPWAMLVAYGGLQPLMSKTLLENAMQLLRIRFQTSSMPIYAEVVLRESEVQTSIALTALRTGQRLTALTELGFVTLDIQWINIALPIDDDDDDDDGFLGFFFSLTSRLEKVPVLRLRQTPNLQQQQQQQQLQQQPVLTTDGDGKSQWLNGENAPPSVASWSMQLQPTDLPQLWHGSQAALIPGKDMLLPVQSHVLTEQKLVFATPFRSMALAFSTGATDADIGRSFGDLFGEKRIRIREMVPGAFDKWFRGRSAWLYRTPALLFSHEPGILLPSWEFVSSVPVPILSAEFVPDVWKALTDMHDANDSALQIHFYDAAPVSSSSGPVAPLPAPSPAPLLRATPVSVAVPVAMDLSP